MKKKRYSAVLAWLIVAASLVGCGRSAPETETVETGVVNIYSSRHYPADKLLFAAFRDATGVRVNLIEANGDALIERLAREGAASPADLFITADAGILWRADQRDLFQPIDDPAILDRAPAQFRGPGERWIGLSKRARIVVYDREAGPPAGLNTYADLADEAHRGSICVRSSSNVYNQSLLASRVAHFGPAAAEAWAAGVVANFARKPQGNDTAQIEAVAAGQCRMAIVNSYYVARYVGSDDAERAAIGARVGVLFPSQDAEGVHINISGVGLLANAPNAENAKRLIAFLLESQSQQTFARANHEYPVAPGVEAVGPISDLGDFKADALPVSALGEHQAEAIKIFDRVGWL